MPATHPTRNDAEAAMRRLLRENSLPEPDEVLPHEDGGILCLWHEPKVAVVIDLDANA
jgi:hypothetical protein